MSKQSGGKEQRANKQSNCRHVSIRRQIFHCECSIVCHYQQRYKCRCPAPSQRNQEIPRLAHFHHSFLCVLCVLCGQLYGLFSSFIGNWHWHWQHFHIGNIHSPSSLPLELSAAARATASSFVNPPLMTNSPMSISVYIMGAATTSPFTTIASTRPRLDGFFAPCGL